MVKAEISADPNATVICYYDIRLGAQSLMEVIPHLMFSSLAIALQGGRPSGHSVSSAMPVSALVNQTKLSLQNPRGYQSIY